MYTLFIQKWHILFRPASLYVHMFLALCLLALAGGCTLHDTSGIEPQGITVAKGAPGTKPYTIKGKTYYPLLSSDGFREEGIASWYGKDFHGKKTANGEVYNMHGMTAAHKLLPFGTQVRVTNKDNGKSIVVRVNDRGPFVSNRVIDLTRTGAEQIGMLAKGTAPVRLETIGDVPGLKDGDIKGRFYVQVGAFANKSNAERMVTQIRKQYKSGRTYFADQVRMWRVQVGPYTSLKTAESAAATIMKKYPSNFVVAE